MKLRKANAILSLITTILLFYHAISLAAWMLSRGLIPRGSIIMSFLMIVFFVMHAIISIILLISTHKGSKGPKGKHYPKLNAPMVVQRSSGVLLILFTWLHIAGAIGIMTPPPLVHAIVPPLFFALVMAHVAVSASKSLITLGIGDAKFVQQADAIVKAVCIVTLIADVVGFYLHVC